MVQESKVDEQVVEPVVEDINTIKGELAKLKAELEQKDKGFKTLQQSLSQRDKELKTQSDFTTRLAGIEQGLKEQREISELQAAAIALGREGSEDELSKVSTLLRTKVAEQDANRKQFEVRRQQEQSASAAQEYNQKADAVFAQAQTLFEGDDLKDIEDLLKSGNLVVAQREIRNASKGKTPVTKVETPKETDDERIAKAVQAELKKRGLLESDNGTPGGSPTSAQQAMSDYISGKITSDEATKRGVNFY